MTGYNMLQEIGTIEPLEEKPSVVHVPFSEYFVNLLNTKMVNYRQFSMTALNAGNHTRHSYYAGKADAMRDAIQDYQELHKEY